METPENTASRQTDLDQMSSGTQNEDNGRAVKAHRWAAATAAAGGEGIIIVNDPKGRAEESGEVFVTVERSDSRRFVKIPPETLKKKKMIAKYDFDDEELERRKRERRRRSEKIRRPNLDSLAALVAEEEAESIVSSPSSAAITVSVPKPRGATAATLRAAAAARSSQLQRTKSAAALFSASEDTKSSALSECEPCSSLPSSSPPRRDNNCKESKQGKSGEEGTESKEKKEGKDSKGKKEGKNSKGGKESKKNKEGTDSKETSKKDPKTKQLEAIYEAQLQQACRVLTQVQKHVKAKYHHLETEHRSLQLERSHLAKELEERRKENRKLAFERTRLTRERDGAMAELRVAVANSVEDKVDSDMRSVMSSTSAGMMSAHSGGSKYDYSYDDDEYDHYDLDEEQLNKLETRLQRECKMLKKDNDRCKALIDDRKCSCSSRISEVAAAVAEDRGRSLARSASSSSQRGCATGIRSSSSPLLKKHPSESSRGGSSRSITGSSTSNRRQKWRNDINYSSQSTKSTKRADSFRHRFGSSSSSLMSSSSAPTRRGPGAMAQWARTSSRYLLDLSGQDKSSMKKSNNSSSNFSTKSINRQNSSRDKTKNNPKYESVDNDRPQYSNDAATATTEPEEGGDTSLWWGESTRSSSSSTSSSSSFPHKHRMSEPKTARTSDSTSTTGVSSQCSDDQHGPEDEDENVVTEPNASRNGSWSSKFFMGLREEVISNTNKNKPRRNDEREEPPPRRHGSFNGYLGNHDGLDIRNINSAALGGGKERGGAVDVGGGGGGGGQMPQWDGNASSPSSIGFTRGDSMLIEEDASYDGSMGTVRGGDSISYNLAMY